MKKLLLVICAALALVAGTATAGRAQWSFPAGTGTSGASVTEAADCSTYTTEGDLCWDTDNNIFYVGDGAAATAVGPGAGSVAADAIFDAAGDLVVGTGANTAGRVAIGAANKVLKSNGTTAGWSTETYAAPGTSGNILKSDGTNWTSSNSLAIATLDMTSSTSSIPWLVGANPTVDATGETGLDSDGANVTGDMTLRVFDGTNTVSMARKLFDINVTVVKPQDIADAVRDALLAWSNDTGMTYTVTAIKCWAGADDTSLNVEETDADGANNATVDAIECATGTGPYTDSQTTITGATIEAGHLIWLDFDDTDDPSYVKITISGWFNAAVD